MQHSSLSTERWAAFSIDQQILMIGNEMNRAGKLLAPADSTARRSCYERVLRLTDLTVALQTRPTLRRELLRWRDLAALLYMVVGPETGSAGAEVGPTMWNAPRTDPRPPTHAAAFRALLRLTPAASRQIPFLSQ